MKRLTATTAVLVLAAIAAACASSRPPGTSANPATAAASGAEQDSSKSKDPFEPWAKTLEKTAEISGFFTFHRKRDNTLLWEIPVDRLDQEFGLVLHYSRGAGDFNAQEGLPLSEARLMRLTRVGDKVHLVHLNPRFIADEGSGFAAGLASNVGHSVVAALEIKSVHDTTKALLADATKFFVSDYPRVSDRLSLYYGQKPVTLAGDRSYVGQVVGFPENVEIDAELTFSSGSFPVFTPGYGVSDVRSIPVGVRYSIFALPADPMTPRYGDDRVGHFLTAQWDFSRDQTVTPYLRYVDRWRLSKADPAADLSEPVEPIVYYVDPSVPEPYRRYVKEGIEGWNKAFEAAGYRNAVVAKDPPAGDSTWSAQDIRYSTVRWTPSYNMGYAIGPSQTDPRTGEILNADILISASIVRFWQIEHQDLIAEGGQLGMEDGPLRWLESLEPELRSRVCLAERGKAHQLMLGRTLLMALGEVAIGEELPEEYVGDAIRDLVLHEVGHTLGLRHNFKASSGIPYELLNDEAFTRENGLTLSVMEYGAVNISPDREAQGHYWNKEVGTYDMWAIRYAYATMYRADDNGTAALRSPITDPAEEVEELRKIARLAADPLHSYGTDEDNWLGSYAVDPLTSAWDLGSDPIAFARDRATLVAAVQPHLEQRLVAEGEGYQRLRGAQTSLIFERYQSLLPVTKTVGGIHFARDHKGDPDGRLPFTPVSAERQREAVQFLVEQAFSEGSFRFDPELLNRLAPNRYSHWGNSIQLPVDYPVHSQVLIVQRLLLGELLAPPRLWRLVDNEPRVAPEDVYSVSELLSSLTAAIWSEVFAGGAPRSIDSFRRNLQRVHLDQLVGLLLDQAPGATPEDARSLARYELSQLSARIGRALASGGGDRMTRAHLSESRARIDQALEVSMVDGAIRLRR